MFRSRSPRVPHACQAHYRFVCEMNLEWPFGLSVALPFVESTYWNDASLPLEQLSEQRTSEYGLAFGVDRGELRLEKRLVSRNKLPVHQVQSSAAVDDAKYR